MDFVVFEYPGSTVLNGYVEGKNLEILQPYLSVEVRSAIDPSKIETLVQLPLSNYFQIKELPRRKLLLKLVSRFPSPSHGFESEVLEVDMERKRQVFVGPLTYRIDEYHSKQVSFYSET